LIFFHEGSSPLFSIITNKNKSDKEYEDLLLLKNIQSFNDKDKLKELPNYKTFTQKQFFKELKNILDINNSLEKVKDSDKKSLDEIVGNYVFTADNFLKMALILLYIRANLPIIMMGETGCGKTSLIRKLSELKNGGNKDKLKILNIHSGTSDDDITNFIHEIVVTEAVEIIAK
jgi:midasin (ATPase involved in ribosome maturation)